MFSRVYSQESPWSWIKKYFPSGTKDNLPYENDFKSGHAFHSPVWLELLVGSRAEKLYLEKSHDQAASDHDIMYLYGGAWGVHVNSECHDVAKASSLLVMDETDCYPGYSRIRFTNLDEPIIERMSQTYKSGGKFVHNIIFLWYLFILFMSFKLPHGILLWICAGTVTHMGTRIQHIRNKFVKCIIFLLYLVLGTFLLHPTHSYGLLLYVGFYKIENLKMKFRRGLNDGHAIYSMLHNWKYVPLFDRIFELFQIGRKNVMKCIIKRSGRNFFSSKVALDLLLDDNPDAILRGPAQPYDDNDYVPALLCSAPFPCVTRYLSRPRTPQWPTKRALEAIATLPGILVPTGKKGSLNSSLEWRQSFSVQELYLTRDMPDWVKIGFRSFKFMVKLRKTRNKDTAACDSLQAARSGPEGHCDTQASEVCSYHLKTVLLWELEEMDMDTWRKSCSFQLMIQLRLRLDHHLTAGHLPHYFNPEHDLLDNVPREELVLMREGAT